MHSQWQRQLRQMVRMSPGPHAGSHQRRGDGPAWQAAPMKGSCHVARASAEGTFPSGTNTDPGGSPWPVPVLHLTKCWQVRSAFRLHHVTGACPRCSGHQLASSSSVAHTLQTGRSAPVSSYCGPSASPAQLKMYICMNYSSCQHFVSSCSFPLQSALCSLLFLRCGAWAHLPGG